MTRIVFALYPGVTQLDFTGPHQVFARLPGAQITCASLTGEAVEADGLVFSGLAKLADVEGCDVLCVPGGYGTTEAIQNPEFLAQIRRLAEGATYVTSVCTGSLILAAAAHVAEGLLAVGVGGVLHERVGLGLGAVLVAGARAAPAFGVFVLLRHG